MSAIAGLFTSLLRLHHRIDVVTPKSCYGETRELMKSFGERVAIVSVERWRAAGTRGEDDTLRVLLLDSCVNARFAEFADLSSQALDLVIFDTTCFWRGSSRIDRAVKWALRARLPMALVRSHAKLDCLGIEYGRLGSIVLVAGRDDTRSGRLRGMSEVAREIRDSIRLFGAAPIPAHFPPFTGMTGYDECSIARTAAIMRNTRRLHDVLVQSPHCRDIIAFQHGLYLALSPGTRWRAKRVKHAAASLCDALRGRGLPVRHSGSFGFDFMAIEWFPDPVSHRNVIRIAPGDVPIWMMNEIAAMIEACWSSQRTAIAPVKTPPESLPCIWRLARRETWYASRAQCGRGASGLFSRCPPSIPSCLERPA